MNAHQRRLKRRRNYQSRKLMSNAEFIAILRQAIALLNAERDQ